MDWIFIITVALTLFTPAQSGLEAKEDHDFWIQNGQEGVGRALRMQKQNKNLAKNIILFIGDGMSGPTITASRIFKAQQRFKDFQRPESSFLTFEQFDHLGHSKTYSIDNQTPDSAASATAIYSGVKTKSDTLGFNSFINHKDVNSMRKAKEVQGIFAWAQAAGMSTGFVTTARITHATPAALYAHTYDRDWECDSMFDKGSGRRPPDDLHDIAWQLIHGSVGNRTKVMLGGGYAAFYPKSMKKDLDLLYGPHQEDWSECFRSDGHNLVKEWKQNHGLHSKFVRNREELAAVEGNSTDFLLGLFSEGHMEFEDLRKAWRDPSLAEMTSKAIEVLEVNPSGFFLMVESARIDHSHHDSTANRALNETVALDLAVERALDQLGAKQNETLIIVTADHSHTMSMAGYSHRGSDIRGLANSENLDDNLTYTILSYANGRGFYKHNLVDKTGKNITRLDLGKVPLDQVMSPGFVQTSSGPRDSETHGGEDVYVYARGPMSHLFHGTYEQTHIAHVMAFSACIGPFKDYEHRCAQLSGTKFKIFPKLLDTITDDGVTLEQAFDPKG